ncbi:MAG: hypothetical protein J5639_09205 [Bacteroidales bacterium]|nr:hypothetical protein [Bacteroidales bacterium]
MNIKLLLAFLLFPFCVFAQERVTVKGRIINEKGEAVEYVQLGVPKLQIGTISTVDGRFEIAVPCDTVEFFHVSYQPAAYPVTGDVDDVVIVLHEQELPPAVFIGGNTKEKYLIHPGVKIDERIGGADFYRPGGGGKGAELGCIAKVRKPFLIKDIQFTIQDNHIPGCVASINVYRIEGDPEIFINVLHKPIYFNIIESDSRQDYSIQPDETILLEPGRYFVALQVVAIDDEAVRRILETPESERHPRAFHMSTALYFKSSYERYAAMGKMVKIPVNIGVGVRGLEYQ